MDRTQRLLAGLLAIQIVVLTILHPPFSRSSGAKDQALLPGLSSITPEKVEIAGPQNASLTLARRGGQWTIEQPPGYPVMPGKVEKLIQDLEHLKSDRQVVSGSRYHASLKVAANDFERRVRVWEKPAGTPKAELFVGSSPGSGVSHVRVGNNDRVYEASGISAFDIPMDAGSWIERNLFDVTEADAAVLEITNRKGRFAVAKQGGGWVIREPAARASEALDQTKVGDLLRLMTALALDQPAGPLDQGAQGFADPEATIVLGKRAGADSTAAPVLETVSIGGSVPGKTDKRYATRVGSKYAVTMEKYTFEKALDATVGDLVATPAPAP
jgi:hypothetical protein